ncbi:hypothetical protein SDC9_44396 [bioreactor metagenome]|uniref:Uncharacterized protein n=1 Tax=bioreactor metagenome TaxID=1076179 RepID=A0A644W3U7_9ZZZZ
MVRCPEESHSLLPGQAVGAAGQGLFHDPVPGPLPGRGAPSEAKEEGRVEAVHQGIHHRPEKALLPGKGKGKEGVGPAEVVLKGPKGRRQLHLLGDQEEPRLPEQPSNGGPSGEDGDGGGEGKGKGDG